MANKRLEIELLDPDKLVKINNLKEPHGKSVGFFKELR